MSANKQRQRPLPGSLGALSAPVLLSLGWPAIGKNGRSVMPQTRTGWLPITDLQRSSSPAGAKPKRLAGQVSSARRNLPPFLAEFIQASLLQILRAHQNAEFATGLKVEKEGLRKERHIRWTLYINYEDSTALPVLFPEVGCLWLDRFEDTPNDPARLATSDEGVERFKWKFHSK
jgi:hypothetical protein